MTSKAGEFRIGVNHPRRRVVVIGGGISGLAAAHRLMELDPFVRITLLEASSELGGVIRTSRADGFLLEGGPDSFLLEKPWASALCERVGLQGSMIPTQVENRRTFVLRNGRLCPIPEGFSLFVPTRVWPLLKSPLFSALGKTRMALDLVLPRARDGTEESVASFVSRRFGAEALEVLAGPLVESIYAGDASRLGMAAILPRLVKTEGDHRSILLGLRRERRLEKKGETSGGARYFLFASLRDGIGKLVHSLVSKLPEGSVRVGTLAIGVHYIKSSESWRVLVKNGPSLDCDALCVAVPAWGAARLFQPSIGSLAGKLESIPYTSSAVVNLGYSRRDVRHPLDGFGFVVPRSEARSLIACSFSSVKFAGRAPEESALFRAFVGGVLRPDLLELEDDALERRVRGNLRDILGIDRTPQTALVTRHWKAMPQYEIGHLSLVESIEEEVRKLPGLALAGNAYHGVGIPDCIHSGELAAESILDWLDPSRIEIRSKVARDTQALPSV